MGASFTPISGGLSSALSGTVEPTKFLIKDRTFGDRSEKRIHGSTDNTSYTILIVIISAILFVTVVAIYDVLRNVINIYYANLALTDPNSHNTPEDIERTTIANQNSLWSSMLFAAICIISAIVIIFIIVQFL